jgi:hypothetical protein
MQQRIRYKEIKKQSQTPTCTVASNGTSITQREQRWRNSGSHKELCWPEWASGRMAPPRTIRPLTEIYTRLTIRQLDRRRRPLRFLKHVMENMDRGSAVGISMGLTNRRAKSADSQERRRGERFPIRVPVRYRAFGETDWEFGLTENISAAGIFFQCNQSAEIHKHVEIDFVLGGGHTEATGTQVVCLGRILRSELRQNAEWPCVLAAEIEEYRLLPWQGAKA